jgi:hypothetical protein
MATQNTTSQAAKLTLTAVFRMVPLILSGDPLNQATGHLNHLVCALTCELLKFATSVVWTGCHILGSYILAHQQLFLCVQTLLSLSRLLHFIWGAAQPYIWSPAKANVFSMLKNFIVYRPHLSNLLFFVRRISEANSNPSPKESHDASYGFCQS